jgi:hypothetical protein
MQIQDVSLHVSQKPMNQSFLYIGQWHTQGIGGKESRWAISFPIFVAIDTCSQPHEHESKVMMSLLLVNAFCNKAQQSQRLFLEVAALAFIWQPQPPGWMWEVIWGASCCKAKAHYDACSYRPYNEDGTERQRAGMVSAPFLIY